MTLEFAKDALKKDNDKEYLERREFPDFQKEAERIRCVFYKEGRCNSNYGKNQECDGYLIPENCPYKTTGFNTIKDWGKFPKECSKEYKETEEDTKDNQINFTKDELFFIEERCDIEASQCMNKFLEICKLEHPEKLSIGELNMLMKLTTELMYTYNMLRQLRNKLEDFRKDERI